MAETHHRYEIKVTWTGNTGTGTASYSSYQRSFEISGAGKASIAGSSDPAFRGDSSRWNPEEMLVAALSACHKLWYLDLCARAGVTVTAYEDFAEGVMTEDAGGAGKFTAVTLRPRVTISAASDGMKALALHQEAHAMCFIARSVCFPVNTAPSIARDAAPA